MDFLPAYTQDSVYQMSYSSICTELWRGRGETVEHKTVVHSCNNLKTKRQRHLSLTRDRPALATLSS